MYSQSISPDSTVRYRKSTGARSHKKWWSNRLRSSTAIDTQRRSTGSKFHLRSTRENGTDTPVSTRPCTLTLYGLPCCYVGNRFCPVSCRRLRQVARRTSRRASRAAASPATEELQLRLVQWGLERGTSTVCLSSRSPSRVPSPQHDS